MTFIIVNDDKYDSNSQTSLEEMLIKLQEELFQGIDTCESTDKPEQIKSWCLNLLSEKEHQLQCFVLDKDSMKPFSMESVLKHLTHEYFKTEEENRKQVPIEYILRDTKGREKSKIPLEAIEFFESNNTSIRIHLTNGQEIRTYGKLSTVENELEGSNFLRCHQSYLINMDYINGIEGTDFMMQSGQRIYIRKRGISTIKKKYYDYMVENAKKAVEG